MPGPSRSPQLDHIQFVKGLAEATGLDPQVIEAWVRIEGSYAPGGTGGYNYLNLRARGSSGYSGVPIPSRSSNGFAQFGSVADAITETAYWINSMPNYASIRTSSKLGPKSQLAAIAASPWDAGHYSGGKALYDSYNSITAAGASWLGKIAHIDWGKVNTYFDPGGGAGLPDPAAPAIKAAATVQTTAEVIGQAASFAFKPDNWLRIGFIIGGGIMLLLGSVLLAKSVGALNISTPATPTLDLGGGKPGDSSGPIAGRSRTAQRQAGFESTVPRRPRRGQPGSTRLARGETIPF